jgi:hypothetical protein
MCGPNDGDGWDPSGPDFGFVETQLDGDKKEVEPKTSDLFEMDTDNLFEEDEYDEY